MSKSFYGCGEPISATTLCQDISFSSLTEHIYFLLEEVTKLTISVIYFFQRGLFVTTMYWLS